MYKNQFPNTIQEYVEELLSRESETDKLVSIDRSEIDRMVEAVWIEYLLENLVARGFILHGQPFKNDKLIPRTGQGNGEKGKLTAVYATNVPSISIFHATTDLYKLAMQGKFFVTGWSVECDENDNIEKITFRSNHAMIGNMNDGYIYVCDKNDFEKIDPVQFICVEEYVPRIRILVTKKAFEHEIEIVPDKK